MKVTLIITVFAILWISVLAMAYKEEAKMLTPVFEQLRQAAK